VKGPFGAAIIVGAVIVEGMVIVVEVNVIFFQRFYNSMLSNTKLDDSHELVGYSVYKLVLSGKKRLISILVVPFNFFNKGKASCISIFFT